MTQIRHSAAAVEDLFRFALRQWSAALGPVFFARLLGVVPSTLARAASGSTVSFELAARFRLAAGLPWIEVCTFPSRGTRSSVVTQAVLSRLLESRPLPRRLPVVDALEERVQESLRREIRLRGWVQTSSAIGIPRSTLHDALRRSRLRWDVVWRLHLLTERPVSELIEGVEEAEERELRRRVGSPDDFTGRFADLNEPVVRLAELAIYNESTGPVEPLEPLWRGRTSIPQAARLSLILAANSRYRGQARRAGAFLLSGWQRLRRKRTYHAAMIFHAAMAVHLGHHALASEVCRRIRRLTAVPSVVSQVYRIMADSALDRLRVDEAASMARRGLGLERGPSLTRDQLEETLAACAWLYGDLEEMQWRAMKLLRLPTAAAVLKRGAAQLILCSRIYLGNSATARTALRRFRAWADRRHAALFECRVILMEASQDRQRALELLRQAEPEQSEDSCLRAICRFLLLGDRSRLRTEMRRLLEQGWSDGRHPVGNLRDFLRTLRAARLWDRRCQRWLDRAVRDGLVPELIETGRSEAPSSNAGPRLAQKY